MCVASFRYRRGAATTLASADATPREATCPPSIRQAHNVESPPPEIYCEIGNSAVCGLVEISLHPTQRCEFGRGASWGDINWGEIKSCTMLLQGVDCTYIFIPTTMVLSLKSGNAAQ